ncbi:hypothetical protein ACJX0J_032138, partial [Zea mays]
YLLYHSSLGHLGAYLFFLLSKEQESGHGRGNWDAMLRDPKLKWILEEQKIIDEPMMEQPKLQFETFFLVRQRTH